MSSFDSPIFVHQIKIASIEFYFIILAYYQKNVWIIVFSGSGYRSDFLNTLFNKCMPSNE